MEDGVVPDHVFVTGSRDVRKTFVRQLDDCEVQTPPVATSVLGTQHHRRCADGVPGSVDREVPPHRKARVSDL